MTNTEKTLGITGVVLGLLAGWFIWGGGEDGYQVATPRERPAIKLPTGLVAARSGVTLPSPIAQPPKGAIPRDTGVIKAKPKKPTKPAPGSPENCPPVEIRYTVSEEKDGGHRLSFESDTAELEATHYQVDLSSTGRRYLNRLGVKAAYDYGDQKWHYGGVYVRDLKKLPISLSAGVEQDRVEIGAFLRF